MNFDEYQEMAGTTAMYPEMNTGSALALAYVGLGLGEAGEIQNKLKKILRDSGGLVTPETRLALLNEAGDVLWYLARMCTELGAELGDVAEMNVEKLTSRKERGVIQGSGDNR